MLLHDQCLLTLVRTASVSVTIIVTVVVGWTRNDAARCTTTDEVICVAISQSFALKTNWLDYKSNRLLHVNVLQQTSSVFTERLAVGVSGEIVIVTLTATENKKALYDSAFYTTPVRKLFAVLSRRIEPPTLRVRTTGANRFRQLANELC